MPTQGERQNYLWRPNDESATTRLRFDLEADHWYRSFKSAEMKHRTYSFQSDLSVIGLLINLSASLLVLVVLCLVAFFKWLKVQMDTTNS